MKRATIVANLVAALLFVGAARAQTLTFTDQTAAAGLSATHTVVGGTAMLSGGAAADFDGDGWHDLFIPMGGGTVDRLYMNQTDGTFVDLASTWNVDAAHIGGGVAAGDVDDDGLTDLFVASLGPPGNQQPGHHRLYRNQGSSFSNIASAAGVATTSTAEADGYGASFGDVDLDGDLDLFVAGWAFHSGGNRLFENLGGGSFVDVTASNIEADLTPVRGFSPHLVDMDGDAYPELLIAADYGTSRYLLNQGDGTYTDHTAASGTDVHSYGMGQTVADLDGDGLLDWYVTSIHGYPPMPNGGNRYFRCIGEHSFSEIGEAAGLIDGGWGWGTAAVDFDHDGDVDIVENNGYFQGAFKTDPAYLYVNDGTGDFLEDGQAMGLDHVGDGRGLLVFDPDNDGDQDIVLFRNKGPLQYFRNELSGPDAHGLRVFLDTAGASGVAADGYGARVLATTSGTTQLRMVSGNTPYLSQSELSAHFGLGSAAVVDELEVRWPHGTITYLADVPTDQTVTVSCCAGWTVKGQGVAGAGGVPVFAGKGTLQGGDPVTMSLGGALPNTPVALVMGLSALSLPFGGGEFVPTPDIMSSGLASSPFGELVLESTWPAGMPSGTELWFQYWVIDAAGTNGWAASNGLKVESP